MPYDIDDLARAIDTFAPTDGVHSTCIPRVYLIRSEAPTDEVHAVHEPAVCVVAQGRKRVMLGDTIYEYDRASFLIVSIDVPISGQVVQASRTNPYLCLRLDIDAHVLTDLVMATGTLKNGGASGPGLMLSRTTPELVDGATRLVRMLNDAEGAKILGPLVERELLFRLLQGEQAGLLKQIAFGDSRIRKVGRAVQWLKAHYREPVSIRMLSNVAEMSMSAFHLHFKAITCMSPLQYQKQLRLQEARRLMIFDQLDAASAAFHVGYESPSQFSREYRRVYGTSPKRDASRLRTIAVQGEWTDKSKI